VPSADVLARLDVLRDLGCSVEGPRGLGDGTYACVVILPTREAIEGEGPDPDAAALAAAERAEAELGVTSFPGIVDPSLAFRLSGLVAKGDFVETRVDPEGAYVSISRGPRSVEVAAPTLDEAALHALRRWSAEAPEPEA
jgi:hypothetical protein